MLGVGEAGGPQATLGETLFQQDKNDEVALGGQGGWSKAELGQPGGMGGGQRGPGGRGQGVDSILWNEGQRILVSRQVIGCCVLWEGAVCGKCVLLEGQNCT